MATIKYILTTLWQYANFELFKLGEASITLSSLVIAGALLYVFSKISKWVEKAIHAALIGKDIDAGVKGSSERIAGYIVFALGILITLNTVGINLNSLAAASAILAVGLGFGLQNITQNFMSGLIILFERPIKKGDIVRVGQNEGRVLDIKFRSTLILTRDDVIIIVPNSKFISEEVVNESFSGQKIRLHIKVGVAYGSDTQKVNQLLLEAAKTHPKVLSTPPPTVIFDDFAESSLQFTLRVWTTELWFHDLMLSEIRFEIDKIFRSNNVTIPFPQTDLHLKSVSDTFNNFRFAKKSSSK